MGENGKQRGTIVTSLAAILTPGQVVEVRGLGPFRSRTFATAAAGELERLADYAGRLSGECKGVYFTPNPLRTTVGSGSGNSAMDVDVETRAWLLVDIDSVRPKDTNATDGERGEAFAVFSAIRDTLAARGFSGMVGGDSGNGYHLMIPVELPNDDEAQGLHRRFLLALKERFDTDAAHVDGKTHNAARIWKLPGTLARKGPEESDRPHRFAHLLETPQSPRSHAPPNTELLRQTVACWTVADRRDDPDAYGRAALEKECGAVLASSVGNRNNRLNEAGFNLGQLIGGGVLDRGSVEAALLHAALGVGLTEPEAVATIRSGIEGGLKKPRVAPALTAWEAPLPLTADPGLESFPIEVFPLVLRRFATEQSWALNVPVDYLGLAMLGIAGGAIGNTKRLRIKSGYFQSAAVYGVFVARPGTKKSAVVSVVTAPLREAERRYQEEHRRQVEDWKAAGGSGTAPVQRRCMTGGGTVEGIVRRLISNPRGLALAADELSGLITGLNQYKAGGKGNDRQFFLSAWDQTQYAAERVEESRCLYVARPFLSLIGAIQPDVLNILRGEPDKHGNPPPDDGFFDRFLVSYPPEPRASGELWREPSESSVKAWASAVEDLLAIRPTPDGGPQIVPLAGTARAAYQAFTEEDAAEVNAPDFPDQLRGPWSKLMGYFGRFTLILHTLDWACDGLEEYEADSNHVERAAKLVRYFKSHARRASARIHQDWRVKDAEAVRLWIVRHGKPSVSRTDIWRAMRHNHRFPTPEDLDQPLRVLVDFGVLRRLPDESGGKPGRPRKNQYEINPAAVPAELGV